MSDDDDRERQHLLLRLRILADWLFRGAPSVSTETLHNAAADLALACALLASEKP